MRFYRPLLSVLLALGVVAHTSNVFASNPQQTHGKPSKSTVTKTEKKKKAHSAHKVPPPAQAASVTASKLAQIKELVAKGKLTEAQAITRSFSNTPLAAYAGYLWLSNQVDQRNRWQEIGQYLHQFPETGWADRLQDDWSEVLVKQQQWSTLVESAGDVQNKNAQCRVIQAKQQLAMSPETWLEDAKRVWLSDKQPSMACSAMLQALVSSNLLSEDNWQQAFDNDVLAQDYSQLNLWLNDAPASIQQRYSAFMQIVANPTREKVTQFLQQVATQQPVDQQAFQQSSLLLAEWAKKQPDDAWEVWQQYKSSMTLTTAQVAETEKPLLVRLAKAHPEQANDWLAQITPGWHDEQTLMPLIKVDWQTSNWSNLLSHLDALPASDQQANIWQYWRARALESMQGMEAADPIYRQLAQKRSFYGFLAADKLGLAYQLNGQVVSGELLNQAVTNPISQRLQALYEAGLKDVAWKEWQFLRQNQRIETTLIPGVAQAAQTWGWYPFAVLSMNLPQHWDYLGLRFAMPYRDLLSPNSEQQQIPLAWAYGIMRRESAYAADVRSRSGAMGLMQLMPKTAQSLESIKNLQDVYSPPLNVHLGTKLLGQLKKDFKNNLFLATAAYNAGGFRVKQWLKQYPDLSTDQFVELIPYKETRDYVKAVMEYMMVFERLDGQLPKTQLAAYMLDPNKLDIAQNTCNPSLDWCL